MKKANGLIMAFFSVLAAIFIVAGISALSLIAGPLAIISIVALIIYAVLTEKRDDDLWY